MVFIIIQMVGYGLLFILIILLENMISIQFFILEGGYPEEKNKTRMARKKDREDVKRKHYLLKESISSYATSLRLRQI